MLQVEAFLTEMWPAVAVLAKGDYLHGIISRDLATELFYVLVVTSLATTPDFRY